MTNISASDGGRLRRHRRRLEAAGLRRVEITVPADDAPLLRELASRLRAGGAARDQARATVRSALGQQKAATGADLVAFLRQSPLAGIELQIERDRSSGRGVDLG